MRVSHANAAVDGLVSSLTKHNFSNLRNYFKLIYQVLLGQEQGPRLGSFIKLFGVEKSISLIENTLKKNK